MCHLSIAGDFVSLYEYDISSDDNNVKAQIVMYCYLNYSESLVNKNQWEQSVLKIYTPSSSC